MVVVLEPTSHPMKRCFEPDPRLRGGAWLFLEGWCEGAKVGGGDGELAVGDGGLQRNGVAAAGFAHGAGSDGACAHLADDALRTEIEADRAADLAGVGDGDDVAVGLLVEQEADLDRASLAVVDVDAEAVELVVVDGRGGQRDRK